MSPMHLNHSRKSIAIIGTGSLACIFAARLNVVANVHIIGSWQDQIDAINKHGITVHELDGSIQTVFVPASCYPQPTGSFTADYVIVLVKSFQTSAVIDRVNRCVKPGSVILTLQNGLGNIEQLSTDLPSHYVSAGITMQGGNIKCPGSVVHAGNGQTVIDESPQLAELYGLFNSAKIPTQTARQAGAGSIDEALWRKLIINSAVNPLTALLGQPNGFLADNEAARSLSESTAIETAKIAQLEGAWPHASVEGAAESTTSAVKVTAPNRSSMLQDISRGSRTEIDSICGEVVKRAKHHGHTAPFNEMWQALIKKAENSDGGSSGRALFTVEDLVQLASGALCCQS